MKFKNKLLIIYFLVTFVLYSSLTSFATTATTNENTKKVTQENTNQTTEQTDNLELNLYSKSCILIECSTNRVAFEKNSNEKMYPASTTKLLTAILALEKCNLSDKVIITNEMISQIPSGYTTAYLQIGETLTVEQLLNALLIPSANDAGYAIAIHISGSIENFAILMNSKAKEIGCTNSNFTNPSGIHNENHYSTAKDMALIGLYSLKQSKICEIGSKTTYSLPTINGITRTFETTNTLLKNNEKNYYEYATGLKTGFTQPAGSCIVATAKKDNMEFLAVILGAPEPTNEINYRDSDCKTLFEYGFTNYETIIKIDKNFMNIFSNLIISGGTLNTIFKFILVISAFYFTYTIVSHSSKKKSSNSKKKNSKKSFSFFRKNNCDKSNNLDKIKNEYNNFEEFKFRCSFW